jgi:hypothetical protein
MSAATFDETDAPPGMVAVSKGGFNRPPDEPANWCHHCHHRPNCDGLTRCGDIAIRIADGSIVERKDGHSVIFRRIGEERPATEKQWSGLPSQFGR